MKRTKCFEVVQKTKDNQADQEPSHDAHSLVQNPAYGVAFPTKVLGLVVFRPDEHYVAPFFELAQLVAQFLDLTLE